MRALHTYQWRQGHALQLHLILRRLCLLQHVQLDHAAQLNGSEPFLRFSPCTLHQHIDLQVTLSAHVRAVALCCASRFAMAAAMLYAHTCTSDTVASVCEYAGKLLPRFNGPAVPGQDAAAAGSELHPDLPYHTGL